MSRREVEPTYPETITFSKLSAGTVLEGKYVGMRSIKTKVGREANVYEFSDMAGEKFEVFGVAALDARMSLVPPGHHVWITYNGKIRGNNGTDRHDVRVAYDEDVPF